MSVPGLVSRYYASLGLSRPLDLFDQYVLRYHTNPLKLQSHPLTLGLHTLYPESFWYERFDLLMPRSWISHLFTLTSCAFSLQLGFLKTSILYFGGAMTGAIFQMIHDARHPEPLIPAPQTPNWINDALDQLDSLTQKVWPDAPFKFTLPPLPSVSVMRPVKRLCGSAGAVASLLGAHVFYVGLQARNVYMGIHRYPRGSTSRQIQLQSLATHLSMVFWNMLLIARSVLEKPFIIGGGLTFGMLTIWSWNELGMIRIRRV